MEVVEDEKAVSQLRLATCEPGESCIAEFICHHPWPLARTRAIACGLGRSPAVHAPAVRSGRSCHAPHTRPESVTSRPAVGSGLASHTRLQQPACAVCFRPRAQPSLRRRLAYCIVNGGRVCVTCHARPAAHTLRVVVRAATLSRLSAHVRSIGQRGWQRHLAGVTPTVTASHQRPLPRSRFRHAAAPQEGATGPRQPRSEPGRACSTSNRRQAPDSSTCNRIRLATPGSKPMPTSNETPPETRPSDPRAPTRSPFRRQYQQRRPQQRAFGR